MALHDPFDEIMIVNPLSKKGERRMKLYPINKSALYGYMAEEPEALGYVAEGPYEEVGDMPEEMGYVADPPPGFTEGFGYAPVGVAYVADQSYDMGEEADEMGYVYETPEEMGYFAEEPEEMGYFADESDEMGYFGEDPEEMGYFGEEADEMGYFAEEPEEMGYFADDSDEMGYFADESDEMGYFADEPEGMEGYVRETREPAFSPRVVPTAKLSGVEGYIQPKSINPTCETIRPADVASKPASTWFKPLW
ncbi:MAG: hypothetical protein ACU84H_17070 [Gammaproteobacteria bacterium]